MFAPIPRNEDIYVTSNISYDDGTTETWTLSRMSDLGYLRRYQRERWRKFFNDNLRTDSNKQMWEPAAQWIARTKERETGKRVTQVQLVRHWRQSLRPGESGNVFADKRPFNHFVFHSATLDPQ